MEINNNGILHGAIARPTPNKSGSLREHAVTILHDTAGSIDNNSSVDWLTNPQARASAHLVITRDGKIFQLASFDIITWHAGKSIWHGRQNVNQFSVGIEIMNPGKMLPGGRTSWGKVYDVNDYKIVRASTPYHGDGYWMPYTDHQIEAVLEVLLALRERYGMNEVSTHYEISPGRKVDVNPLFPLAQIRGKLEGRQDGELTIHTKPGAVFREWPSFYTTNVIDKFKDDDSWFTPVKSGVYKIEGDFPEIPNEIRAADSSAQLWYQVLMQAEGQDDKLAWVWSGHVKEPRA